jgi:TonB family protein
MTSKVLANTSCLRRRSLELFTLALACAVAFWPRLTHASDLEEQLKAKYQNQVLTLRHFYEGSTLHFDSGGHLVGEAAIGSWTVDGQIDVTEVHLDGQTIQLKGKRRRLVADPPSGQMKDVLATTASDAPGQWFRPFSGKRRREFEKKAQIEVDLDLTSIPKDEPVVTSAVNAVFLPLGGDFAEVVPEFWKDVVLKQEGKLPAPAPASGVYNVGGGSRVSPPRAISAPDPKYSEVARQIGFEGTAVLSLILTPQGTAQDIRVVKPLGLGLDEEAVRAVSSWEFEPARKDGNPVSVHINVEVTFRLY